MTAPAKAASTLRSPSTSTRKDVSSKLLAASEAARSGTQRIDRELQGQKTDSARTTQRLETLKADADRLEDLLRGISEGAEALAAGDGQKFMTAVALRTAPPRSSTTKDKPKGPAAAPQPAEDTRSPMQKLLDRFR